ncbi:hypothetical protein NK8_71510 (plasmid) [Caballeronia sp. NK8]|uniref:hypothetical protein n=1 Tax=Caballeronia sp. NK8 TaxID=140098 RepID=UPI001BB4EB85|nr:hypothetical protein [Caballeronia sp. NK8]BCQ28961.1 hypothetical protein NK8_71510 [Caballeronia sp. NK8]
MFALCSWNEGDSLSSGAPDLCSSARPDERSEGRTEVCFRYITKRRPHRAYDVYVALREDSHFGEIDIRHAARMLDDMPSFTSGFLSVERLRAIVGLIGLIERVTSQDRSRVDPGALVYGGHVSFPFERRNVQRSNTTNTCVEERVRDPNPRNSPGGSACAIRMTLPRQPMHAIRRAPPSSARHRRYA